VSAFINTGKWSELPKAYQAAFENACAKAHTWMVAKYDAQNPKALRELVAAGTKLHPFPQAVMEACYNAANELYAETSAKNAKFKKVYDQWKAFRNDQVLWFRVAEGTFDNFMFRASAQNKL
jgi:TRAP-type mannitol/chloroaromatic compound transport system substrate-binding protein